MRRTARAVSDRQRQLLINTGVAAVYLVLAVLLCSSAWRAPTTTYIGQGPDPIQQMWGIAWVPLPSVMGSIRSTPHSINTPTGTDLLWNAPTAVVTTVLWPVTALFGAIVTYNLALTLGLVLAAFFAFLVIRRWVSGGVVAAAVGGLLYGFSPYMTGAVLRSLSTSCSPASRHRWR